MAYNNELEGYSHPVYTRLNESRMCGLQGPVSLTDFAHFRSRNTVIVRAVHIKQVSVCSAPSTATNFPSAGTIFVTRSAVTTKTLAVGSLNAGGTGASYCITLVSANTLHTITEVMALRLKTLDKGEWDVLWEYDVIYPATKIGS